MAVKSFSIRSEEEMLRKIGFIADYEGRSVNSHVLVLIRNEIKAYEDMGCKKDQDLDKCSEVLFNCVNIIANVNNLLKPFLPFSSEQVEKYICTKRSK